MVTRRQFVSGLSSLPVLAACRYNLQRQASASISLSQHLQTIFLAASQARLRFDAV